MSDGDYRGGLWRKVALLYGAPLYPGQNMTAKQYERGGAKKSRILNSPLPEGENNMLDVMISDGKQAYATISCRASIDLSFPYC